MLRTQRTTLRDVKLQSGALIDLGAAHFFNIAAEDTDYQMVIAIPGFTMTADTYNNLAHAYQKSGRIAVNGHTIMGKAQSFVALDNAGWLHGKAVNPRGGKVYFEQLTLDDYTDAILAQIEAMTQPFRDKNGNYTGDKPIALLGHSMGGLLLQKLINDHPDIDFKKRYGIDHLVFMGSITPRQVYQAHLDTGHSILEAQNLITKHEEIGLHVHPPKTVSRIMKMFARHPNGETDKAARMPVRPEPFRIAGQVSNPNTFRIPTFTLMKNLLPLLSLLIKYRMSISWEDLPGRPSISRNLFKERGLKTDFIAFGHDTIVNPDETNAMALHLAGDKASVHHVPKVSHSVYITDPHKLTL